MVRDGRKNRGGKSREVEAIAFPNAHSKKDTAVMDPPGPAEKLPVAKQAPDSNSTDIVLIDNRSFFRECITRSLKTMLGNSIQTFPGVDSWIKEAEKHSAKVVLLSTGGQPFDEDVQLALEKLSNKPDCPPVILFCDNEHPDHIVEALNKGARGYIPTSLPLAVTAQAIRLVMAGGAFAPTNSLIAARNPVDYSALGGGTCKPLFTSREAAVVDALRHGKPNKIIAHELKMCESTVKVHVRNIMKKLNAKNRTEVALFVNELLGRKASELRSLRSDDNLMDQRIPSARTKGQRAKPHNDASDISEVRCDGAEGASRAALSAPRLT